MRYLRLFSIAFRVVWPHLLTPWRSPLLRWRMETYGICDAQGRLLHADEITPTVFARFLLTHSLVLMRFLRWAACLDRC